MYSWGVLLFRKLDDLEQRGFDALVGEPGGVDASPLSFKEFNELCDSGTLKPRSRKLSLFIEKFGSMLAP